MASFMCCILLLVYSFTPPVCGGVLIVWSVRADWLLDIEDALSIYMAIGTGRFKTWRHRMHKLAIYGN